MYNGEHSITFGTGTVTNGKFVGTNTWKNWYLIPSSKPVVTVPKANIKYVAIPGSSVPLDLTTYLTGGISYGDREGKWEFYVDNDHAAWYSIRNQIMDFLHGKVMKCVLEDEPNYYYEGRFKLDQWQNDTNWSKVTIGYTLRPYKRSIVTDDWLWDPFNFELDRTDIIITKRL